MNLRSLRLFLFKSYDHPLPHRYEVPLQVAQKKFRHWIVTAAINGNVVCLSPRIPPISTSLCLPDVFYMSYYLKTLSY